jgi:multidrug efflux pump subunit AcrB
VREVVAPVTVSSFTTMAGFLPLVLMTGIMGKFMRIIPITVSLVLFASLIEALFILPSHFVDIVRPKASHARGVSRMRRFQDRYVRVLTRALRWRYLVLPMAAFVLAASFVLIPLVGVDLFAGDELSTLQILITMPDGTRLEQTDTVALQFEAAARRLPASEVLAVLTDVGLAQRDDEWTLASHVAQVRVDVPEAPDRDRDLDAIIDDLRRLTRDISGPVDVEIRTLEQGPPADAPVEVMLKGPDLEVLGDLAERLKDELRALPGVLNVRDDLNLRQPELDVVIDREAAARHGLDPTRIARSVRAAFAGSTATSFRHEDEEVDVIVRFPESFRTRAEDISQMRFVNPAGATIPFTAVARLEERSGPLLVRRHDRERSVSVMADVDPEVTDIGRVNAELDAAYERLRTLYPGVRMEPGGQFAEFWQAFEDLTKLFALGLLINFMLMAGQFKSWTQPLVIMAVVPLSFIGAMLGLLVSGDPFSVATLYGFVALAGVAVNDSIVLIDFVNQQRRAGVDRWQSIREAGRLRLRPILLTSITTIFGLLPMAVGLGGSSKTWQPLAITITAGLAVATVICLLVIPCLQAIVDDVAGLLRRRSRSLTG